MRPPDRTLDFVAALFISAGAALFFIGRRALAAIAAGTYELQAGVSWVARTEHHDLQTTLGTRLVIAGFVVAVGSAALHLWSARRSRRVPTAERGGPPSLAAER